MFQPKKTTWFNPWSQTVDPEAYNDLRAQLDAVRRHQAVIEFTPDGLVLEANHIFLDLMGYTLGEVVGKHHGMFVDSEQRMSSEYRSFWDRLRSGQFQTGQFRRVGRGGKEIWIQGTYTPVVDPTGKTVKVVKYAIDTTERRALEIKAEAEAIDYRAQIDAVWKNQAVIEFTPEGTVINANPIFLSLMGYALADVRGGHHSQFVHPDYRQSNEYRQFWDRLRAGEFQTGQFRRMARNGREVWITGHLFAHPR